MYHEINFNNFYKLNKLKILLSFWKKGSSSAYMIDFSKHSLQ